MSYFGTSFHQSLHVDDRSKQSTSEKKMNRVRSGFGDEAGARAAFCRGDSDMKVSQNDMGASWFWGGGEMSMPPNGMRPPWFMGGCQNRVPPPVPPTTPAPPCPNVGHGIGVPWTTWGRVEMTRDSNGVGKAHVGGKPLTAPPAPHNLNKGRSTGAPWTTQGRVDGPEEVHFNGKPLAAPPSEKFKIDSGAGEVHHGRKHRAGNINIDPGFGVPLCWGEGEIKVPPNANVHIGLGAGGINSGKMSASINDFQGTINF